MKLTNTISAKMMQTLDRGKKKLGREARELIRTYIESQRIDALFFRNKSREADIYYTVFGLALSYIFGLRIDWEKARRELDRYEVNAHDLVHYASYIRSSVLLDLSGNKWRRLFFPDKERVSVFQTYPHNDSCSPYSRFVWLSLMEDMHRRIDNKKEIMESLGAYRTPDGGYSNSAGGLSASAGATAAALSVGGQLAGYGRNLMEDVKCLYELQDGSGGFCANNQTPLPDMLSTATALFVLRYYGVKPRVEPVPFIEAHWLESGGFAPTLAEENSDIEYTFYGMLALGTC
jgi:hypothetical protein